MVKKAAQATPNQLLRRARLERGWTQQTVAERIGAPNAMMVTRWERGKAFPSSYYIERLCQLFELKASNLGLLKESSTQVVSPASEPLVGPSRRSHVSDGQIAKKTSSMPPLPRDASASPLSHLPLVGREVDAHVLQDRYQAVQQGQMQVVIIQGEAGIGKTRLASSFLSWASTQGATLLQGRAYQMGGTLPYQPLVHALSRYLEAEPDPEALLSSTWLSELSRILPDLHDRYPHLPVATGNEGTARFRLFEAVTRLLQALCEQASVVLFLDDIQWADAASLAVLHYVGLSLHERGTPLLLLLAVRAEALTTTGPLHKWLTGLYHDLPVMEVTLGPLSQEETLHLLAALGTNQTMNKQDVDRLTELGQWLFRETHGQPFYLVETLRVLLERKILTLHRSAQAEEGELELSSLAVAQMPSVLAPNVRRLILSQLERLTMTERTLVNVSAILGQATSFEVLCRIADLQEGEALAALDEVLGHGLLREVQEEDGRRLHTSPGTYLFGHDKMREMIYTEMGEAQRRLFHRRALAVCETLGRPAAELAHHARASGLTEQAAGFSLEAGDEAAGMFANVEASLHYGQALEALLHWPETIETRSLRVGTLLKLVGVSYMTVSMEQSLERLAEAEKLAQTLPNQRLLASVHYWITAICVISDSLLLAQEYAVRMLAEARELGDNDLEALAAVQLSRVLVNRGDHGPIEDLIRPILPRLERLGNWAEWISALGFLGIALAARGKYAEGLREGQRAMELVHRTGDMKSRHGLMCHNNLSVIALYGNDSAQMFAESSLVVEGAEPLHDWLLLHWGYGFRAWAESRLGKHEEALQSMMSALHTGQILGQNVVGQNVLEAVTAELLFSAGQVEEAQIHAQAAIAQAKEKTGCLISAGIAQRVWGQAQEQLGHWEEAEKHLNESWYTLLSGENLLEAARTQVIWGLICRNRGETASAQAHFEQAVAQFETSGLARELAIVRSYLAQTPEPEQGSPCACGCGRLIDGSKSRGQARRFYSQACRQRIYRHAQGQKRHVTAEQDNLI